MSTPYQRRMAEQAALSSRTAPECLCGRREPQSDGRLGHSWTCIYWRWLMQGFC